MRYVRKVLVAWTIAALSASYADAQAAPSTSPSTSPPAGLRTLALNHRPDGTGRPATVATGVWVDVDMPAAGHRSATVRIVTRRPAALSFTDFLCSGDRMAALDHGRVIADASPLVIAPTCDVYDPQAEAAFFDNRFTAGLVLLPAGTHELSFLTLSSFTGGFAGAFRIDKCTEVATGTPLLGTPGDDVLCGGPEGDVVAGDGGRDLILGGPGPDRLVAGAGAAALAGGSGGDVLVGAAGRMRMVGGRGGDVLVGGPGPDSLNGQAGDDRVFGRAGNDAISGGHGDDVLSGGLGRDICIGGPGTDLDLSCER